LLLWQPSQLRGRTWRKVPLSCVEDFSVKLDLGKWGRWVTFPHQDWGIPFFTCYPKLPCPTVWSVHRPLCPLGLDLTEHKRPP
jgi:hypothetical protein